MTSTSVLLQPAERVAALVGHHIAGKRVPARGRGCQAGDRPGQGGRTAKELANELACTHRTINGAVGAYGKALLEAGPRRRGSPARAECSESSSQIRALGASGTR